MFIFIIKFNKYIICLEKDKIENLISPCLCRGTTKYIHEKCLNEWGTLKSRYILQMYQQIYTRNVLEFSYRYSGSKNANILI